MRATSVNLAHDGRLALRRSLSITGVRAALHREIARAGSLRAYARQIHVSAAYLCDVLSGNREPGPKVLTPLGITKTTQRVVHYERRAATPSTETPNDE